MSKLKVAALQGLSASSDAITLANDGTCTANITNNLSNRNLVINGGMNVNQYGSSSSTSTGRKIFDRWNPNWNNGTITQSKETLTSGGAYDAGHRSCLRLTNTSAAGSAAGTYVEVYYKVEAQDLAKSGWNYKSASSYITLSFWLRSSVAQTYSCTISTRDGTKYLHPFTAVISSANTWTKITKTFAGNSNLQIDDDNGDGLMMWVNPMQGSDFHNNSWNTDGWFAQSGSSMFAGTTDTTWGTTAGATWDITGFQLEVGDHATDFEHRSYGQELALCERYCQIIAEGTNNYFATSFVYTSTLTIGTFTYKTTMRTTPSLVQTTGTNYYFHAQAGTIYYLTGFTALSHEGARSSGLYTNTTVGTAGQAGGFSTVNSAAQIRLEAEI